MTVLILSEDMDFSQTLAEQVKKELGVLCQRVSNKDDLKQLLETASVAVIPDAESHIDSCPIVRVTKTPVRMQELLEEIALIVQKPLTDEALELGHGYVLQWRLKQLLHRDSDKRADLTDKETQLLQCLAEAGDKGATKEQLLKQVWDIDALLDTHTLETHIYRLRGKFRELNGIDNLIAAIEGGYKLELS